MNLKVDSKVLTYHGPLLYEARILKVEDTKDKGSRFLIHYRGWKTSWDEWVPESRILAWNEENLRLQKKLKEEALAAQKLQQASLEKKERNRNSEQESRGSQIGTRVYKRKDNGFEQEKSNLAVYETAKRSDMRINVPDSLKSILVDDWEKITKNQQLVSLPRSPTAGEVIEQFLEAESKREMSFVDLEVVKELMSGLVEYFNTALGQNLLYRFERQQLLDLVKGNENKNISDIYGPEHLLRLFVDLPEIVSQANVDIQSALVLKQTIERFIHWMAENQNELFQLQYINPSPNYHSLARGN